MDHPHHPVLGVPNFYHKVLSRDGISSLADTDNNTVYFSSDAAAQGSMSDWPSGVSTIDESIFFKVIIGDYGMQVLFNSKGVICIRQLTGGGWQTWKKTTLV